MKSSKDHAVLIFTMEPRHADVHMPTYKKGGRVGSIRQ